MKNYILSLAIFAAATSVFAQQVFETEHSCNFDGQHRQSKFFVFEPSGEANQIVSKIVQASGLPQNFTVKLADCKNTVALTKDNVRYLFYSNTFLEKFRHDNRTKWSANCVLAHQIAHLLKNHDLQNADPAARKAMENEAEKLVGEMMFRLNATLAEAQTGIRFHVESGETAVFPQKSQRMAAVETGWKQAKEDFLKDKKAASVEDQEKSQEWYNKAGNVDDPNKKIKNYTKAIELNPRHAQAYNNRGLAKNELGKFAEAIQDFDAAIELDPRFVIALNNRGWAKQNLGQYDAAIQDFEKAFGFDPNYALAYCNKGCTLVKMGNYRDAVEWLQRGLNLNSSPKMNYAKECLKEANSTI